LGQAAAQNPAVAAPGARTVSAPTVPPPPDYVIGADDVLDVTFWRDKEMSAEVAVRPDGKIALPLLNEVQAAGLTPEQLRLAVTKEASRFVEDPNATVVVKAINSRKVYITGQVSKPGMYSLAHVTTILQLISMAGGLQEYADQKDISVLRTENGKPVAY